jgi:MSHA biogenesis protein MshP
MFLSAKVRSGGLGLVSAIFLILVVGVLVVAIARMVRTSGDAFAQDVISHRAFLAAESGAQLGLNRVFAPAGAGSCTSWTFDLDGAGLPSCAASVSCTSDVVAAATYYTLTSAGRCDVGGFVAERRVLVRAQP